MQPLVQDILSQIIDSSPCCPERFHDFSCVKFITSLSEFLKRGQIKRIRALYTKLPLLKLVARALKVPHSSSTFSRAFQNCKNHQNPTTIARLAKPDKIPEPRPVVRTTRSYATRSGTMKKKGNSSNFQPRKVFNASK